MTEGRAREELRTKKIKKNQHIFSGKDNLVFKVRQNRVCMTTAGCLAFKEASVNKKTKLVYERSKLD